MSKAKKKEKAKIKEAEKKKKGKKKSSELFADVTRQQEAVHAAVQETLQKMDAQNAYFEMSAESLNAQKLHLGRIDEETERLGSGMHEIAGKMDDLAKRYSKHDLALGDVVDGMEDFGRETQEKLDQMDEMIGQLSKVLGKDDGKQVEALLKLCIAYQDQLDNLTRFAASDPNWAQQLRLVQEVLEPVCLKSTFQPVGYVDEAVQYDWHEVLDVQETLDPEKDMHVAEVYERGYLYQGKVLRKARVSVWRMRENQ